MTARPRGAVGRVRARLRGLAPDPWPDDPASRRASDAATTLDWIGTTSGARLRIKLTPAPTTFETSRDRT